MNYLLLCLICISGSVKSWDYDGYDDFPGHPYHHYDHSSGCSSPRPPTTTKHHRVSTNRHTKVPTNSNTYSRRTSTIPTPPRVNSVPKNTPPSAEVLTRVTNSNTLSYRDTTISTPPRVDSVPNNTPSSAEVLTTVTNLNTFSRRTTPISTPPRVDSVLNNTPFFAEVLTTDTNSNTVSRRETTISTPPRVDSVPDNSPPSAEVSSSAGEGLNSVQQRYAKELYCLEVLGKLVASEWRKEINKIPVTDLKNISTEIKLPEFNGLYSNSESEWIQEEGMALQKLDTCVRNLVANVAPAMDRDEIKCLNDLYPSYLARESEVTKSTERFIRETSQEELPFRSFYSYFDLTQILFDNKNIDALDSEVQAIHEDMLMFYIKTEEDKEKKIFVIEQECEWKDARDLREASSDDLRYEKFRQLVKARVNIYLVAEILRKWVPGSIIPEYRYKVWGKARAKMEKEIDEEIGKLRDERRDAQYLCIHAARLGNKFLWEQKAVLFDNIPNATLSSQLATYEEYSRVVALRDATTEQNDYRRVRFEMLAKEYRDGHYCLTNFVRMIENHQRYVMGTAFVNEKLPYGKTYCWISEMSAELVQPRYCKCQGTFCEEFGLATVRAERYQLNLLPNNTYTVTTNPSYRVPPLDELIESANKRIYGQKFNTFWYRNQKNPPKPELE